MCAVYVVFIVLPHCNLVQIMVDARMLSVLTIIMQGREKHRDPRSPHYSAQKPRSVRLDSRDEMDRYH
uniref:Putative secreted protein n=1 Tax=Anopheles darlingi TaxID=43151 RepID=A0A2M4DFK7_ANODA